MPNTTLAGLLFDTNTMLDELREERRALVADLDEQIKRLEQVAQILAEGASKPAPRLESSEPAPGRLKPGQSMTPAQKVMMLLKSRPGLTPTAVADVLENEVEGKGTKSPRRMISTAIHDLKNRGKIREEDGRLFLADSL